MALGFVTYVTLKLLAGHAGEIPAAVWAIAEFCLLKFVLA